MSDSSHFTGKVIKQMIQPLMDLPHIGQDAEQCFKRQFMYLYNTNQCHFRVRKHFPGDKLLPYLTLELLDNEHFSAATWPDHFCSTGELIKTLNTLCTRFNLLLDLENIINVTDDNNTQIFALPKG